MRHILPVEGVEGIRRRPAMGAALASASTRSDSIKGLAQSIAKPAYSRLLNAEPALRRAVPALIIAFLVTVAVGAAIQIFEHRRQTIATALKDIDLVAALTEERLDHVGSAGPAEAARRAQQILETVLPARLRDASRLMLVTDNRGEIIAATPAGGLVGRQLLDVLGPTQPLTTFGASAGVLETTLANGTRTFATVHDLGAPFGQLAVVRPYAGALAVWQSDSTLTVTLSATTGFVVLILGFAFHWQATRAREADLIFDTVRARIDTALNRGRCGLWDWDLGRGRVFWSHSMFAILGLEPKDELLTFGEVDALVHPDDIKLYELANQFAAGNAASIDRAFRMRHAGGD